MFNRKKAQKMVKNSYKKFIDKIEYWILDDARHGNYCTTLKLQKNVNKDKIIDWLTKRNFDYDMDDEYVTIFWGNKE